MTSEMLQGAVDRWRRLVEEARSGGDIQAMKKILFPHFITRVELGYRRVRMHYAFPVDLQQSQERAVFPAGVIETTFDAKRRSRPKRPPRPTSARDWEIYNRHMAGETIRALANQFGLSETRVWGICTKIRKHLLNAGDAISLSPEGENK